VRNWAISSGTVITLWRRQRWRSAAAASWIAFMVGEGFSSLA